MSPNAFLIVSRLHLLNGEACPASKIGSGFIRNPLVRLPPRPRPGQRPPGARLILA